MVTIPLAIRDLGYYNEQQKRFVVEPGDLEIQVGASSSDIRLSQTIRVD
jgi:beta-glucosidase